MEVPEESHQAVQLREGRVAEVFDPRPVRLGKGICACTAFFVEVCVKGREYVVLAGGKPVDIEAVD